MRFIAVESRDLGRSYGLGMLHVRYRARRNHGTLFEPLAARQRIPGTATDVLVMRIGAVGHRAVEGRGGRHDSRRGGLRVRPCARNSAGLRFVSKQETRGCSLNQRARNGQNTDTPLRYETNRPTRHCPGSVAPTLLSGYRAIDRCPLREEQTSAHGGAEVNYRDCSSHFLGCGDKAQFRHFFS